LRTITKKFSLIKNEVKKGEKLNLEARRDTPGQPLKNRKARGSRPEGEGRTKAPLKPRKKDFVARKKRKKWGNHAM